MFDSCRGHFLAARHTPTQFAQSLTYPLFDKTPVRQQRTLSHGQHNGSTCPRMKYLLLTLTDLQTVGRWMAE